MHLHLRSAASALRSLALVAALAASASPSARSELLPPAAPECAPAVEALFDCNANGIEDAVDIATGSSGDANRNGVPDECETSASE